MRSVGLDLGARHIAYCEVANGKVVDRTTGTIVVAARLAARGEHASRSRCVRGLSRRLARARQVEELVP
jgi:hypothetical protein